MQCRLHNDQLRNPGKHMINGGILYERYYSGGRFRYKTVSADYGNIQAAAANLR